MAKKRKDKTKKTDEWLVDTAGESVCRRRVSYRKRAGWAKECGQSRPYRKALEDQMGVEEVTSHQNELEVLVDQDEGKAWRQPRQQQASGLEQQ